MGKTTQYCLLKQYLEEQGYDVCSHHFPSYNTKQGSLVEQYLKGDFGGPKDLSPYVINSMYAIDRAITWSNELGPKYDSGSIILLDRYTTSSLIYQSSLYETEQEKVNFIDFVEDYEYNKMGLKRPDKVIFLTGDFELLSALRRKRVGYEGNSQDVYERDTELLRKIYDNSSFIADYLGFDKVKCDNNGSFRSIEDINEEIIQKVKRM